MSKLIIVRGISGSGKSTWSNQYIVNHPDEKVVIVNRDKIRQLLFGTEDAYGVDEDYVTDIEKPMLVNGLKRGYTVISDNTNINLGFVAIMLEHWMPAGTEVEILHMPLDLERALMLNKQRERRVPEDVIHNQHASLSKTKDWKP